MVTYEKSSIFKHKAFTATKHPLSDDLIEEPTYFSQVNNNFKLWHAIVETQKCAQM